MEQSNEDENEMIVPIKKAGNLNNLNACGSELGVHSRVDRV